jgi:hypothetical protein
MQFGMVFLFFRISRFIKNILLFCSCFLFDPSSRAHRKGLPSELDWIYQHVREVAAIDAHQKQQKETGNGSKID